MAPYPHGTIIHGIRPPREQPSGEDAIFEYARGDLLPGGSCVLEREPTTLAQIQRWEVPDFEFQRCLVGSDSCYTAPESSW